MNPPFRIARAGWAATGVAVFFVVVALYYATDPQPEEAELTLVTGKVTDLNESRAGIHIRLSGVSTIPEFTYSHVNGSSALVLRELGQNIGRPVTIGHLRTRTRTIGTDDVFSISIEGRIIRSSGEVAKERLKNAAIWWGIALAAGLYAIWRVKADRRLATHDA